METVDDSFLYRMMACRAGATGEDVAEVFELEPPTPDELRRRATLAEQEAKAAKQAVKPHVSPAYEFRLEGSKRPADRAGQGSLF